MGGGTFSYDVLGRQVHQVDTVEGGASVYDHALSYDAKGRVYYDAVTQRQGSDTVTTNTSNSFADGTASYALGAVTGVTTSGYRLVGGYTYQSSPNTSTTQNYAWYDGAVLSSVYYTVGSSTQHTDYVNTATGTFVSATVYDGRQRTISVTNDVLGQALRRDEADGNNWNLTTYAGGDPIASCRERFALDSQHRHPSAMTVRVARSSARARDTHDICPRRAPRSSARRRPAAIAGL